MYNRLNLPCECYECAGSEYIKQGGRHVVQNNLKWHTFLEPCTDCGKPKTEYLDLGHKGYYACWWCRERTADSLEVPYEYEDRVRALIEEYDDLLSALD